MAQYNMLSELIKVIGKMSIALNEDSAEKSSKFGKLNILPLKHVMCLKEKKSKNSKETQ